MQTIESPPLCPYCGSEWHDRHDVMGLIDTVRIGYVGKPIAKYLAKRFNKWTPTKSIVLAVYSEDPNGGPTHADVCVRGIIATLKPKLAGVGLLIESRNGCGYRMRWRDAA